MIPGKHRRRQQLLRDWRERRGLEAEPDNVEAPGAWGHPRRPLRARRHASHWAGLALLAWRHAPSRTLSGLVAAVLAGLSIFLLLAPRYRVSAVELEGGGRIPAVELERLSGLRGRNIFLVDPADVARRLEQAQGLAAAEVRLALPNRAVVRVREYPLVLDWRGQAGRFGIDSQGWARPLDPGAPGPDGTLVSVTDEAGLVRPDHACIPRALAALAGEYGRRFGPLTYRAGVGFIARSAQGWEVWLGEDAALVERQAALFREQEAALLRGGQPVRLVDLRFPNRPYVR